MFHSSKIGTSPNVRPVHFIIPSPLFPLLERQKSQLIQGFESLALCLFLWTLSGSWTCRAIGRVFWPLWTASGFRNFCLFGSFLGLIWGTGQTDTISILLCFVHFIIKCNFIFLVAVSLYLSILGRIGAGNNVIEELILLLDKESSQELHEDSWQSYFYVRRK